MPVAKLLETHHFRSALTPAALCAAIAEQTEQTDWPPRLIMKLSGGGIVSRVMEAPETALPFFGLVQPDRIRLALSSRGQQVTPFQPILLVKLAEAAEGSRVEVTLRPHKEARSFAGLFALIGGMVILAAIPAALSGEPAALLGMLIGAAGLVFPTFRAHASFRSDRDLALAALTEQLPLTPDAQSPQ